MRLTFTRLVRKLACRPRWVAACFALFALPLTVDGAQALTVIPVRIALPAGQRAATLTIVNESDIETSVQVRAYAWDQREGADTLTASPLIVASPPIATIAPHGGRLVRLFLRQTPTIREETYRILLDQLPTPSISGTVSLVLRLSIPIFVAPLTPLPSKLSLTVEVKDGQAFVVARNDGRRHETLRDVTLTSLDGTPINMSSGASPYILAGATRRWPLPRSATPGHARFTANGDEGSIIQMLDVPIQP